MSPSVHPTAEVSPTAAIGDGTRIWHWVQIREGARIGRGCNIGKDVYIDVDVVVGDHCKIQNFATLYTGVTLANNVFIGPAGAVVTTNVPPQALVAGVPAKCIGWVCDCGRPLDRNMRCDYDGKSFPALRSKARKSDSRRAK